MMFRFGEHPKFAARPQLVQASLARSKEDRQASTQSSMTELSSQVHSRDQLQAQQRSDRLRLRPPGQLNTFWLLPWNR